MANQVTMFKANDGTLFESAEEADAHNTQVDTEEVIKAYSDATGVTGARDAYLKRHLLQFVQYTTNGVRPPAEEVKERKPRAKKTEKVEA